MEFLRKVSVLFFIAGISCDDGLVTKSLLIYLQYSTVFHDKLIYLYQVCFIFYMAFIVCYRVLDIEFPSLSVNAPQNGDIILQVILYILLIFFLIHI